MYKMSPTHHNAELVFQFGSAFVDFDKAVQTEGGDLVGKKKGQAESSEWIFWLPCSLLYFVFPISLSPLSIPGSKIQQQYLKNKDFLPG
jgi:hypothetical protein